MIRSVLQGFFLPAQSGSLGDEGRGAQNENMLPLRAHGLKVGRGVTAHPHNSTTFASLAWNSGWESPARNRLCRSPSLPLSSSIDCNRPLSRANAVRLLQVGDGGWKPKSWCCGISSMCSSSAHHVGCICDGAIACSSGSIVVAVLAQKSFGAIGVKDKQRAASRDFTQLDAHSDDAGPPTCGKAIMSLPVKGNCTARGRGQSDAAGVAAVKEISVLSGRRTEHAAIGAFGGKYGDW
jgi:hypothetical protein